MPYHGAVYGWRQVTIIIAQLIGLLFSALDASIISTSLITISIDLQNFLDVPWVVLSYLLAYLGCAIGFAKLSDIFGRLAMLCCSWILFIGFSIGCARSATMTQLIACRAFQGTGAAGLYSLSQTVLFEVGPSDKPGLMGGLIGVTLAMSYVLGPILGAVISSISQWTIIFWINVPAGVAVLIALYVASPSEIIPRQGGWGSIRRIDFIGNITVISACTLLVYSLQEAGSYTYRWDSTAIVVALSIASLSWVTFFAWEIFIGLKGCTYVEPIFPLRLFFRRVYAGCVICTFCTGYIYLSFLIILPERFQIVTGESPLYSGIHLLPMLGSTSFGAFVGGTISRNNNNTSWTLMLAHVLQLIGIGLMSTLKEATTETKAQYGFQVILGLGFGLALSSGTIMASVQSMSQDLAVAQGAIAQARVFGGAIGIAICSVIFNRKVAIELDDKMDIDDLAALHHSPTIAPWLPDGLKLVVRSVYASAFASDTKVMIGVATFGVIASTLTYESRPPVIPSTSKAKRVQGILGIEGQSDTELILMNA
ncbi:MFS general substrate transporter [Daldinia sp. FL1419]|nr:MFS general substrate transporter [Daldinia sp. FL1419]